MKVSIITVCYNSAKTIESTIKSVLAQSYPNIEYIIVDGLSKDNTMDVINNYRDQISQIVSEKDKGIYDAMNKGLKLATGDVIGVLNSDDFYISNHIIQKVVDAFHEQKTDAIYANIKYVQWNNLSKVVRTWKSVKYYPGMFQGGKFPAHPTFFVKKKCYEQFGLFNLNFKLSADFELMLRFLEKEKISSYYLDETFIAMRDGGASNQSLRSIALSLRECYQAFKVNQLKVNWFFYIKTLWFRVKQLL